MKLLLTTTIIIIIKSIWKNLIFLKYLDFTNTFNTDSVALFWTPDPLKKKKTLQGNFRQTETCAQNICERLYDFPKRIQLDFYKVKRLKKYNDLILII